MGHGFFRAHLTPWVGLYSVMSEDSVRKLAKTVFPLYENKHSKRRAEKSTINKASNSQLGPRWDGVEATATLRSPRARGSL